MTLLLKLSPTRDTAVFSGDKRLTNSDGSDFEDFHEKVTPLGQLAVGGACGLTRAKHKETGEEHFSVQRLANEFFADKAMDKGNMATFGFQLQSLLLTYQMQHGAIQLETEDGFVFAFAGASLDGNQIWDHLLTCNVHDGASAVAKAKSIACNTGTLLIAGDKEVREALASSNHPALDFLHAQPDIRELLGKQVADKFDIVSIDRAIEVCRLVTRVCSEQFNVIKKGPSTISPECDVFLLDQAGVRKV